jgi:hypothetical protein
MRMMNETKTTAAEILEKITSHLAADKNNVVVVSTAYRATEYKPKHASYFSIDNEGNLRVQAGKRRDIIAFPHMPLVAIRFGTYKKV